MTVRPHAEAHKPGIRRTRQHLESDGKPGPTYRVQGQFREFSGTPRLPESGSAVRGQSLPGWRFPGDLFGELAGHG
jgi:hypothetical protein